MTLTFTPKVDYTIFKGTDESYTVTVKDTNGLVNLTNCTITVTIAQYVSQTTPTLVLLSTDATHITILTQSGSTLGQFTMTIASTDTASVDSGRYLYQVSYVDGNSLTHISQIGYFYILTMNINMLPEIRGRLQEAGEIEETIAEDEYNPVVGTNYVKVHHQKIQSVIGVWLSNDLDKTGTNYYTGGSFDPDTNTITLGSPAPAYSVVKVDYIWSTGLTDEIIYEQLERNRIMVQEYTGILFTYDLLDTDNKVGAMQMAMSRTILTCILTINGANAAQLGYNFRLGEFEFQSKLWGEGMIAQSLFQLYQKEYEEWKETLGKDVKSILARKQYPRYDINHLTFHELGKGNHWYEIGARR